MIKLKGVTKYYTSDNSVTLALKNVNLEFRKGEFIAITGKSGSGKSTLLNIISGMDTYEDGEMYVNSTETSCYDSRDWEDYRRENISFVYQSYNLIDSYTALENVEAVLRMKDDGGDRKERRRKALEALEKVGLKKRAGHKAVHLSSGQKQRLGIARALAKDTDIIIADEPTGNLDVENGKTVMKLLSELSGDKLVIVVTHNFEQVKDYATRKIRLFDGEVAEDIRLKPEFYEKEQEEQEQKTIREQEKTESEFRRAAAFVRMNRRAQPHRTFFLFALFTVLTASFFIFYGYLLGNMDDTVTKEVTGEAFSNIEKERLVVRKPDGSAFTQEELSALSDIRYADYVDPYDYANEISCLYKKDRDYTVEYQKSEGSDRKSMILKVLDENRFVKSAEGLSESDLTAGTLPKESGEVVVPSEDESLIGSETEIYFRNKKWSDATWIGGTFTITGIVDAKEKTPYFSSEFLKKINVDYGDSKMELNYTIIRNAVYENRPEENNISQTDRRRKAIFVEGEGLTGNQIRLSSALTMNVRTDGAVTGNQTIYENISKDAVIQDFTNMDSIAEYPVEVAEGSHGGSAIVIETSREFLDKIYGTQAVTQVSVYMDDYAYTDRVIQEINGKGYQAVSPYRVSCGDYDKTLVQERLTAMLLSAGSIIVIFFLGVLVIYAIMRLKKRDFVILKSLGLRQAAIERMNLYELVTTALTAAVVLTAAAFGADRLRIRAVSDIVKYYQAGDFVIVAVIAVGMAGITAVLFNRYLSKFLGGKK